MKNVIDIIAKAAALESEAWKKVPDYADVLGDADPRSCYAQDVREGDMDLASYVRSTSLSLAAEYFGAVPDAVALYTPPCVVTRLGHASLASLF